MYMWSLTFCVKHFYSLFAVTREPFFPVTSRPYFNVRNDLVCLFQVDMCLNFMCSTYLTFTTRHERSSPWSLKYSSACSDSVMAQASAAFLCQRDNSKPVQGARRQDNPVWLIVSFSSVSAWKHEDANLYSRHAAAWLSGNVPESQSWTLSITTWTSMRLKLRPIGNKAPGPRELAPSTVA